MSTKNKLIIILIIIIEIVKFLSNTPTCSDALLSSSLLVITRVRNDNLKRSKTT